MPKFAANLHYLFTEVPFLDRFEAAAEAGFKAVEFQVPYEYPGAELKASYFRQAVKNVEAAAQGFRFDKQNDELQLDAEEIGDTV